VIPHAEPAAGRDGVQLLTGLALCGDGCRQTVHGGGASHKKPIYRCRTSAMPAGELPHVPGPHVNRLAEPVDDLVERLVIDRLSRPDAHELLVDHDRADVPALRDEANAFRGRLDALAMEFADGESTASQLRVATDRLRARLAEIKAQIADAGRLDLLGPPLVTAEECATAWGALSLDRRRAVIKS
jgi:site-specific DNA recombinase